MRIDYIAEWTFLSRIEAEQVPILLDGEKALVAFETKGSTALFTNIRLLVAEATSKEMNIFSIPYSNILMWNSSTTNNTTVYEIYTKAGVVKITLRKSIDPIKFDQILTRFTLARKK